MKRNRLLLLAMLLLGVGFAVVSTTLYINGNVKIATNNADFDVKFTKAVLDGTDISADAISSDGKTITFGTKDLSMVNDISRLDFEITNNSAMYDAEVSVELTANGAKKDYYEITKEVPNPIAGKRTKKGNVQVRLLKASVDDFSETFTCTLKVTAAEREQKAEEPHIYYALGNPETVTDRTTDYRTLGRNVFMKLDENEGQKSVCIVKNGSLECFGIDNYPETVGRLQSVFGETNFHYTSSTTEAEAISDDFFCEVQYNSSIKCEDYAVGDYCTLSYSRYGDTSCNYEETSSVSSYTPKYFEYYGNLTTASTTDYTTLKYPGTETPVKVFAGLNEDGSKKSVCIVRNSKLACFATDNVQYEKRHVKNVFSDITCKGNETVTCDASDFSCSVSPFSSSGITCEDLTTGFVCDSEYSEVHCNPTPVS